MEKLGDPLPRLDSIVDWQAFRPLLKVIHQKQRKSNAGRKPHDVTLMFKILVLQSLCNLSEDQTESQVRDRLSFQRFLQPSPEVSVRSAPLLTPTDSAQSFFGVDRLVVGSGWLVNVFNSAQKAR